MAFLKFRGSSTTPLKPVQTTATNAPLNNADIDGNFASLNDSKLEDSGYVSGDVLYANAFGDIATLTKGSNDQTLKLSGGFPTWADNVAKNLETGRTISITGDLSYTSESFDGSSNVTAIGTLATVNSDVGTFNSFTVNAKGLITAASNQPAGSTLTDDTATNASYYLGMSAATTGAWTSAYISSSKLYFNPSTGQLNATDFNSLSDVRYKKDFEKITGALDKVKTLVGYTYTLVDSDTRSTGLIAQDVEKILPEAIGGNEDKKTLNYGAMLGLVVEAIKELDDKLEDIRNNLLNK